MKPEFVQQTHLGSRSTSRSPRPLRGADGLEGDHDTVDDGERQGATASACGTEADHAWPLHPGVDARHPQVTMETKPAVGGGHQRQPRHHVVAITGSGSLGTHTLTLRTWQGGAGGRCDGGPCPRRAPASTSSGWREAGAGAPGRRCGARGTA